MTTVQYIAGVRLYGFASYLQSTVRTVDRVKTVFSLCWSKNFNPITGFLLQWENTVLVAFQCISFMRTSTGTKN